MPINYYEVLGVSSNASPGEIQIAYRRAAIQSHPDRGGDHSKMILINEAYGVLGDPELRAEYDRLCRDGAAIEPGSAWWSRTESVRTAAAAYPATWADFEKWVSRFTADVSNAKYGKESWNGIAVPCIDGSASGTWFCIIGAALGVLIIGVYFDLYPGAHRVWNLKKPTDAAVDSLLKAIIGPLPRAIVLFSPILIGSWMGYYLHRWVHTLVMQQPRGVPVDPSASTHEILVCNGCGQKVRVPRLDDEIVVTCPKCRTSFSHGTTKAESDARDRSPADEQSSPPNVSPTPSPEKISSSQPSFSQPLNVPAILLTLIGLVIASIAIFGMVFLIKTILWILVVACAAGVILFAAVAISSDTKEEDKPGAWIAVAFCFGLGFLGWLFIPSNIHPAMTSGSSALIPVGRDKAQLTLNYWNALAVAAEDTDIQKAETSADYVVAVKSMASQIDRLSTVYVDEDACQAGVAMRMWLESVAEQVERQNSPEATIGILASGLRGDFLSPILDAVQIDQSLQQRANNLRRQIRSTRALLSSRYGVEFKHLD